MTTTGRRSAWWGLLGLVWAVGVGAQAQGPVVDVAWLAAHLEDPGLVILQMGPDGSFEEAHVPGARPVPFHAFRVPERDGLRLELPEPAELEGMLEGVGISDDSRIVLVQSGGWVTPVTRILFTLDAAGFGDRSHLLDGGLEAWSAAGQPVEGGAAAAYAPGTVTLRPVDRVVSGEWVLENGSADGVALIDARAPAAYDGVESDSGMDGHIPGAGSLFWQRLYREEADGAVFLRPDPELRALFQDAGFEPGDLVVGYCHIGQYATAMLLAARRLGYETRLYDGSTNEWRATDWPRER